MGSARLLSNSDEFVLVNVEDLKSDIKILPKEQKGYVNALDITQMSPKGLVGRAKVQRQALDKRNRQRCK